MSTLADRAPEGVVAAAGGVLLRARPDGTVETALVHREKYGDWSLPKGKLDAGEHVLAAAVREVTEETGERVVLGRRSLQVRYTVPDGPKRVDYWLMRACGGSFAANAEIAELRWVPLAEAGDATWTRHGERDSQAELLATRGENAG